MPTREDFIYAAGVVDGEGQVTIDRSIRPRMTNPSYSVYVNVYNTNRTLTDYLFDTFGGSTSCTISKNPKHKDEHKWTLYGNSAVLFLSKIKLFLRLKNKQADICISLQQIINNGNLKHDKHLREELYQQVNDLNKRGAI
jgi:hypothetical protein